MLPFLEGSLFQGPSLPAQAAEQSRTTQLLPPRLGSQDLALGDTGAAANPKGGRVEVPGLARRATEFQRLGCCFVQSPSQSAYLARISFCISMIIPRTNANVGLRVPVLADPAGPGELNGQARDQFLSLPPTLRQMSLIKSPRSQLPHS